MDTVVQKRIWIVIDQAGKLLVKLQSFVVLSPQEKLQTNRTDIKSRRAIQRNTKGREILPTRTHERLITPGSAEETELEVQAGPRVLHS